MSRETCELPRRELLHIIYGGDGLRVLGRLITYSRKAKMVRFHPPQRRVNSVGRVAVL